MSDARENTYASILKRKPFKVLVCLVTLVAFSVNIFSYDLLDLQAWASEVSSGFTSVGPESPGAQAINNYKQINIDTFSLPSYLGTVQRKSSPPQNDLRFTPVRRSPTGEGGSYERRPVVIHVQDAHCNYAAQKQIAEIIEYLNNEYGIDTVNLEGGAKGYDLSVFTDIADNDLRKKVSDHFVREGLVNGAEYFAINNPGKIDLWGVEDVDLYCDNLRVYLDSLSHKDEIDKHLNNLSYILTSFKIKIFSPELLDLDTKYTQYKADNIEFKDYLGYLVNIAKKQAFDINAFPNISLLNKTLADEENIDFRQANIERDKLIDILQKKLSKKSLEDLVVKTVEYRSEKIPQADFYAYLSDKAMLVDIDLDDFQDLKRYTAYIAIYSAIDKMKISDEIERLDTGVKEALYQNDRQRDLGVLSKRLSLLKNLFNVTLTRDDYNYYKTNKESFDVRNFTSFIDENAPLYDITPELTEDIHDLDRYRGQIEQFYEYSLKRDEAFVKNILFAKNEERRTKNELSVSVLITGGFHSENLSELFKKQSISYISIMPNFKNCDGYLCPYFSLLSGRKSTDIHKAVPQLLNKALAIPDQLNPLINVALKAYLESVGNPMRMAGNDIAQDNENQKYIQARDDSIQGSASLSINRFDAKVLRVFSALSKVVFGAIVIISFMNPYYSNIIHYLGVLASLPFIASGLHDIVKIYKRSKTSRLGAVKSIVIIAMLAIANLVYGYGVREIPHDTRVIATNIVHMLDKFNSWAGGNQEPPRIVPAKTKTIGLSKRVNISRQKGFGYGSHDIVSSGYFSFVSKLHYIKANPKLNKIVVRYGGSTVELARKNLALAGINGGYVSRQMSPIGLVIVDGKELFPYTSSRIEVELWSGKKYRVPAYHYMQKIGLFANLESIKSARQYAPDGLIVKKGIVSNEINPNYINSLIGAEAIFTVFEDGSVHIYPAIMYEDHQKPFDGSVNIKQAIQTGPITYFNGKRIRRNLVSTESLRGKVAYAIDKDGILYLMTTDSFRGVYGMTYDDFTESLISFGKTQGINFDSIAFGDAGGCGTLTYLDESSGHYKVTGAAVKYESATAILVLPSGLADVGINDSLDWHNTSLADFLEHAQGDIGIIQRLVTDNPSLFIDWWSSSNRRIRSKIMDIITPYLVSVEDANQQIGAIFVMIAKRCHRDAMDFLELLGPVNLSRLFINYTTGDFISDSNEQYYGEAISLALASDSISAAQLLVNLSLVGLTEKYPISIHRLPPNKFHGMNSGAWLFQGVSRYDETAAIDIIKYIDQMHEGKVVIAQFFETILQDSWSDEKRDFMTALIEAMGFDWVSRGMVETVSSWLPKRAEYYHRICHSLTRSVNSFPDKLKDIFITTLANQGINWEGIEAVEKNRNISDSIEKSMLDIYYTYKRAGLFTGLIKRKPGIKNALNLLNMARKLRSGYLDSDVEALYVMATLNPSFIDRFDIRHLAAKKIVAMAKHEKINDVIIDRLADLTFFLQDLRIQEEASQALIRLFYEEPEVLYRNIRASIWLASQTKDIDIQNEALDIMRKAGPIEDAMMRIEWSGHRHFFPSPITKYRDALTSIFSFHGDIVPDLDVSSTFGFSNDKQYNHSDAYKKNIGNINTNLIGKLYADPINRTVDTLAKAIQVTRAGNTLTFTQDNKPLYDKFGNKVEGIECGNDPVDLSEELFSNISIDNLNELDKDIANRILDSFKGKNIYLLHDNDHGIRGATDNQGNIYLTQDLLNDPESLFHEIGETFKSQIEELTGINTHTYLRGCGKNFRAQFNDVYQYIDWNDDNALEDLIDKLGVSLSSDRTNEDESKLIRYNYSQGLRGRDLMMGLQEKVGLSKKAKADLDKLWRKIESIADNVDNEELADSLLFVSHINRSINTCFASKRPDLAGQLAIEALKNKVAGVTIDDIHKSINTCFDNHRPDLAGQLAIEALKNEIEGITAQDVRRWINICFKNHSPKSASRIAIEALNIKVEGITGQDVRGWIARCIDYIEWHEACLIKIKALTNNIEGVTIDDVRRTIDICFQINRTNLLGGSLAIEAIRNKINGVTVDDVRSFINACFEINKVDVASRIAMEAMDREIGGITSREIQSWIAACNENDRPDWASQIAIEALTKNIGGITSGEVRRLIDSCFDYRKSHLAGSLSIAALKNSIDGVTIDDVNRSISACFNYREFYWAGPLAVEALENRFEGLTSRDVRRWIDICFNKSEPYWAGKIATQALKSKIDGITIDDVHRSINACFDNHRPDFAGQLAIEAVKNKIEGITSQDLSRWMTMCFENNGPEWAGRIAIEISRESVVENETTSIIQLLKAVKHLKNIDTTSMMVFIGNALKYDLSITSIANICNIEGAHYFLTNNLPRLMQDLPAPERRPLVYEILNKEGSHGLYMILKFLYEFKPMFADNLKASFIRYYLGSQRVHLSHAGLGSFVFRFGRNYVRLERRGDQRVYVITKVFDSKPSAEKELYGLRQLEAFGRLQNPRLNEDNLSVTYSTIYPGLFIMPTEFMAFASKEERRDILRTLLKDTISQIYYLANTGHMHTSISTLSHRWMDQDERKNMILRMEMERANRDPSLKAYTKDQIDALSKPGLLGNIAEIGGNIRGVKESLKHLNFRPGVGLVDAEHILDASSISNVAVKRLLAKYIASSIFEVSIGMCYAGMVNGLSNNEIVDMFNSLTLDDIGSGSVDGREARIFMGAESRIEDILKGLQIDEISHQRDSNGLLPWLENNMPYIVVTQDKVAVSEQVGQHHPQGAGGKGSKQSGSIVLPAGGVIIKPDDKAVDVFVSQIANLPKNRPMRPQEKVNLDRIQTDDPNLVMNSETSKSRAKSTRTAIETIEDPGSLEFVAVVGLPYWIAEELKNKNINPESYLASLRREISRVWGNRMFAGKEGFGDRQDVHKLEFFIIDEDASKTLNNIEITFSRVQTGKEAVIFVPQLDDRGIDMKKLEEVAKDKFVDRFTLIPDAYSDIDTSQSRGFPEINSRIAITALIARYKEVSRYSDDNARELAKSKALKALTDYLGVISGITMPVVNSLVELLEKMELLKIRPVDYKDLTDWGNSYEAIAMSV